MRRSAGASASWRVSQVTFVCGRPSSGARSEVRGADPAGAQIGAELERPDGIRHLQRGAELTVGRESRDRLRDALLGSAAAAAHDANIGTKILSQTEREVLGELLEALTHVARLWIARAQRAGMRSLANLHPVRAHIVKPLAPEAS